MPVILATQEEKIRRITVQNQPEKNVHETLSQKKSFTKIGLVEWLKVKAPVLQKKKKKKKKKNYLFSVLNKWEM
jgi:hypothetical protein